MPPPRWQALPPHSTFLTEVVLRWPLVLPRHSGMGTMWKKKILAFLDMRLVVKKYVDSCTTTSSRRLVVVSVIIIVSNGVPFLSRLFIKNGGICFTTHAPSMFQILRW